jgi:hypothetical protein
MKTCPFHIVRNLLLLALLTLDPMFSTVFAQVTAFTYQGRLNDGVNPANGNYDFRFRVASDPFANNYVGGNVFTNALPVSNGLFTVALDFGGIFNGSNYWLEIAVRTNGVGGYATLSSLQPLTPVPYAIMANSAENLLGPLSSTQLSGAVPSANLSGTYSGAVNFNNGGNSFTGNGGGLINVNAATFGGLGANQFWMTAGNSNTIAGTNFLGTVDNQPLELRAGNIRAVRLEPGTNSYGASGAPNVIGGAPNNFVDGGIIGATIAGGGAANMTGFLAGPSSNHVSAIFGTIGGGRLNTVNADHGFIGGGLTNTIEAFAFDSVIGGGYSNTIHSNATRAVIAGGSGNANSGSYAAIGGGNGNANAGYVSSIGGGGFNFIGALADTSFIGGGWHNQIVGSYSSTVAGTIAGGYYNNIYTNGTFGAIGGGYQNNIQAETDGGTIGGGYDGYLSGKYATIPGGFANTAIGLTSFAAGRRAKANHDGAFVWADSQDADFASTATNQFNVRANGGARFVTGGAGMTLDGPFQGSGSGLTSLNAANISSGTLADARLSLNVALLNAGLNTFAGDIALEGGAPYHHIELSGGNALGYLYGSFPALGDGVHLGYNYYYDAFGFGHVSNSGGGTSRITVGYGSIVLAIGAVNSAPATAMLVVTPAGVCVNGAVGNCSDRNVKRDFAPVSSSQILEKVLQLPVSEWSYKIDAATRHIGPMAQDFYSTFNVGADDKHITTIDEGGVALAAIQGLNQKMEVGSQKSESGIQRLEAENADLKQRNESLEKRLNALEQIVINKKSTKGK